MEMKSILQELAEDNGLDCRSYSGRGMYGKTCLGIDCELGELLTLALELGALTAEPGPIGGAARTLRLDRVSTDSMGRGTIYYWPGIEYVAA